MITGGCHCGAIRFALDWKPDPTEIPARACSCSFCTARGALWTACPDGLLTVHLQDPALRSRYRFGTETATFHVCARCGGVPVVTSEAEAGLVAVVNVQTISGLDAALLRIAPVSFDGWSIFMRFDEEALKGIADVTKATYFHAKSATDLSKVY